MVTLTEQNKAIVTRFNHEFIAGGNEEVFRSLVADDVVNHSAPPGAPNGAGSMVYFIQHILRTGFPDIQVTIHDQIAEGNKVTTRKTFHATHTGEFMGIPASGKKVAIEVIDIIRLRDGKYVEHWAVSNLAEVCQLISKEM
jgi:steroid delta-isomerase-like uncharacterized protein